MTGINERERKSPIVVYSNSFSFGWSQLLYFHPSSAFYVFYVSGSTEEIVRMSESIFLFDLVFGIPFTLFPIHTYTHFI